MRPTLTAIERGLRGLLRGDVEFDAVTRHLFAPNPSSENYCSLGGMIANNSSGGRSVAYGATKDHVLALDVVLSGGELFHAVPVTRGSEALAAALGAGGRAGAAFADILPLLDERRGAIAASMPRVMKNCSGYRVETVLEWGADAPRYGAYDGEAAVDA